MLLFLNRLTFRALFRYLKRSNKVYGMHWQKLHPHFKEKFSWKEASFSLNSINRKTIDLYNLLHGKAIMFILELWKCVRCIRQANCKKTMQLNPTRNTQSRSAAKFSFFECCKCFSKDQFIDFASNRNLLTNFYLFYINLS